ncbi:unnamed protein product [Thelazia callipaeda]|uniref:Conserved oligomeric Golgi complex subunit 6 n=1 Tax=Thelazia callipaeda TaxID=103827 RepID=A0A0N5CZ06_THECL|nr:unnamed protein product [Thelazia callipaeda]
MEAGEGSMKPSSSSHDLPNPIKKKVESLVSQKLHADQDFLKMVDYVAPMVDEIDIHVERRLQHQLEERKIKANRDYLQAFGEVNDRVQNFAAKVRQLNSICQDMTNRIQSNKAKTQDLLAKTASLQNEKLTLEKEQSAINDFLTRYTLTSDEEAALKGSEADGTVDTKFFAALQRVKHIHNDSKNLLRSSGEHLAALEIMEQMASKLEQAYEVLYRSIQRECRVLNVEFLELKGVLMQSIAALQDREVLFKYALDEYVTARRNHLVRAYIDALTRGGVGGTPKPIELVSHDPLRYIGDMLAWIHQAMATEKELLQTLLKLCSADVLKENGVVVTSQISEALCRPFKIRVEQALTTETNCVVLYRLSCLFTFYLETMASSLCPDAMLLQTFTELKELTLNLFFSALHSAIQKLLVKMGTPDYDLLPVSVVHQVLLLLKEVLESHDGAVANVADKKENFEKIFSIVLDPLNQAVQLSASELHAPVDVAVYTLNCLSAINSCILLYHFTDARLEMIKAQVTKNVQLNYEDGKISGMESSRISSALILFDSFLANPDHYKIDQSVKLSSVRLRDLVRERTTENIVAAYRIIYDKVIDSNNGYSQLSIKNVEQVVDVVSGNKTRFTIHLENISHIIMSITSVMFSRRRIQRHGNEFVYFLIYRLFTTPEIPPVTLTAIIFQTAVFLDFIPFLGSDRIREMCLMPSHILYRSEWLRMIASPFMHASDMHLFFNMISLLWKGKRLEPLLGSSRFLFLLAVFTIFTSGTMVGLSYLADELMVLNDSDFMSNCAIGFSGVIFALKVLHTTYFPHSDQILFQWFIIPSKYACWIELFLIKLYVPNSSFIGHLSGILVGLAYTMGPLKMLVDFLESVIPLQFGQFDLSV